MPVSKFTKLNRTKSRVGKRKKKSAMDPMGIRSVSADYSAIVPVAVERTVGSSISPTQKIEVFEFTLGDILNPAQYTMFDQYRLNWIEFKVVPIYTSVVTTDADVTGAVALTDAMPNYVFYVDRDDATTALTYDNLRVRKGAVTRKANQSLTRKFRPNCLSNIYNGILANAHKIVTEPTWIDMAQQSVPHYGVKFVLESGGTVANQFQFKFEVRYCFSFANRRT